MAAAKKRGGLGRGLSALLGEDVPVVTASNSQIGVAELELDKLQAGQYQPRSLMEQEKLEELAESIRQQGVISPIIVRPIQDGRFEIIAGERRFRASRLAGKQTIPAIVRQVQDRDALAMALIENMQREDLNVMEEAIGEKRLIDEFEFTHEQAAEAIGRSRSAISNMLRLLNLTDTVQQMIMDGKLEMGHARALLPLGKAEQVQVANEVISRGLSVRETERLVSQLMSPKKGDDQLKRKNKKTQDDLILEERLSEALSAPVHVQYGARGRGQVVIDFSDLDDLDAIIAKIAPNN